MYIENAVVGMRVVDRHGNVGQIKEILDDLIVVRFEDNGAVHKVDPQPYDEA
jgi:hypothetical protein